MIGARMDDDKKEIEETVFIQVKAFNIYLNLKFCVSLKKNFPLELNFII